MWHAHALLLTDREWQKNKKTTRIVVDYILFLRDKKRKKSNNS